MEMQRVCTNWQRKEQIMTKDELNKIRSIVRELRIIAKECDKVHSFVRDCVVGSEAEHPYRAHIISVSGYCSQKADEIQKKLDEKAKELMDERDKINNYIYSINDSDVRQIITLKYINGLTWREIGECIGYSWETVRKKHDRFMNGGKGRIEVIHKL